MITFRCKTSDNSINFISSVFSKLALFSFFWFVTQNIIQTGALRSFDYPGNKTDYLALLAIKSQLVDHPDGVLSSWNSSIHHCNWDGITCGRKHHRVTVLDLYSRGLSGKISPFIGNLSFLNAIYLYNNSLYGRIPDTLGDLFRLEKLALWTNTLVGEIPSNLSSCVNLKTIDIQHNQLEGELPAGLGTLSKLEMLYVNNNNFTGPLFNIIHNLTSLRQIAASSNSFTEIIPNSIDRMKNLVNLSVADNELYGTLPTSLFSLPSLQVLDIAQNYFNGQLPAHMGFNASNLIWLSLVQNNFSGSIPVMTNFTNLMYIYFQMNSFTGRVPNNFGQLQNLKGLGLALNYLEGDINFISTLVNCTQLTSLELVSNDFTGVLPESVANLSKTLTEITIGASSISGILPAGITNLINLRLLDISETLITSSIPYDIGKLRKLEYLRLNSNKLTGKIPDSLGNLSHLGTLHLEDNKLEGSIPPSIGDCRLLFLDLSNNELNGTLETQLFTGLATFVGLYLSNNNLEGSLPLEIGKQTSLEELLVYKNKFSGTLPDSLSECTELQYLYMDGNSFHGEIPSSYASLTSLKAVYFSHNNLSGPIPQFFYTTNVSINYLDLSYNDFQGRVPTNSVFANASAVNLIGNTRLCGGIPKLHLPKCTESTDQATSERKKRTMPHSLRLIIPAISALVGVLVMVTGIYLACFRKKKTSLEVVSETGETFMKVSYDMLVKSTSGFSSDKLLGSGSFGSVFKGNIDGKPVAVKVINLHHHSASKSFIAECKALKNVRHRNLVGIITVCSSIDFQGNDFRALVYEFMPNGSLDKWLNSVFGNLSLPQRVGVAIDVAHALNYLHHECETPIMHCDLKPSNILLDQDMVAHVGDFGLTRFLTQPRHPNQSSTLGIMGTIGYAAPEYGLGSEASTAGDVYSYGILLLELITGKSPTDNMFKEQSNLHMYAQEALPDQVLQIIDPTFEEDNLTEEADHRRDIQGALQRRLECIVSVIQIGVSCSSHLPQDRMRIPDAISRLEAARDNLVATNRRKLPAREE